MHVITPLERSLPQSHRVEFATVRNAPGTFGYILSEETFAVALHKDGTLVMPDSPARNGELISILGTGFGPYDRVTPYGFALPYSPKFLLVDDTEIFAGDIALEAEFVGGAPGYSGADLLQIRITDEVTPDRPWSEHLPSRYDCVGGRMARVGKLVVACLFALVSVSSPLAADVETAKPNVVLILTDDLGYGDLSSYGGSGIHTPVLDRMADNGMRFTQVYSASPLCTPSRAALMTGRLPIRTSLTRVLSPVARRGLPQREITIAELLRQQGYATAAVGKWHLGRLPKNLPTRNGFDQYFGLPYSNDMSRKTNPSHPVYRLKLVPPLPLVRDGKIIEREPDQDLLTKRYTEEAVRFIREAAEAGRPFFLYMAHTFPHPPLHASEEFRGSSPRGLYGDVVEEIDWSTGQIMETLRALGVEDNTLVIFTSDNGPWLKKGEAGGSPGPFREGKGSTYEGGVRVPLLASWPGKIPAGVTTDAFATLMDIFPTVGSLVGAELPQDLALDGSDISGVLLEKDPGREPLFFYWFRRKIRAVRSGPWKLHIIVNEPSTGSREATKLVLPALYHLGDDPGETVDVASKHPDIVHRLVELIEEEERTVH